MVTSNFKFIGGALCVDFLNTVGGRAGGRPLRDKFARPYDLTRWCEQAGLSREPGISTRVLHRAVTLREALFRICRALLDQRAPSSGDVRTLNRELALARTQERLRYTRRGFELEADPGVLGQVARSAADLLTSERSGRLRQCGDDECGWMFLDTSRNGSRRWCQMKICGNRAKARNFRKRLLRSAAQAR